MFGPLGASRTVSSCTSLMMRRARRGSGSVSASWIRSASRSGLMESGATRAARRLVVGCQARFNAKMTVRTRRAPSSIHSMSAKRSPGRMRVSTPAGAKAAPRQRRLLDLRGGQVRRIGAKSLLPRFEQTGRAQRDTVDQRVGSRGHLAGKEPVDLSVRVLAWPPDQLDGHPLTAPGDPSCWTVLDAPRVQPLEPRRPQHT
jgi:hypothetical protein